MVVAIKPPPAFHQRAKAAHESAFPSLWVNLEGAWCPSLGIQGATIFDLSGYGHHAVFGGTDLATAYTNSGKFVHGLAANGVNYWDTGTSFLFGDREPYSVFAGAYYGGGFPFTTRYDASAYGFEIFMREINNTVIYRSAPGGANDYVIASNQNDGNQHTYGISVSSHLHASYVDGQVGPTLARGTGSMTYSQNLHFFKRGTFLSNSPITLSFLYIWRRALLAEENFLLNADPYCWLRRPEDINATYIASLLDAGVDINIFQNYFRQMRN